jgi:hypothetical protein
MATLNLDLEVKNSEVAVERSWVFGEAQVRFLIDLQYSSVARLDHHYLTSYSMGKYF